MTSALKTLTAARAPTDVVPRRTQLLLLCLLAAVVFALLDLRVEPLRLATSLGDADDATRLVEVRELIAAGAWFDRTLPRLGAPEPLVSHWSRLIDAPLVILLKGFQLALSDNAATLAMRVVWPLTLFLGLLVILARQARLDAGMAGALAALGLAVYAHTGIMQFVPGRIDHHNAMILGAVGGTLLLTESLTRPRLGILAGSLLGLGVAVGYEGLGLTAVAMAATSLLACWTGRGLAGVTAAAVAFAATLALAVVATIAPSQWHVMQCDALSGNLVLLAVAGAAGLVAAGRAWAASQRFLRLSIAGAGASIGLAAFALAEPACLSGPFGLVDPIVRDGWLANVQENQDALQAVASLPMLSLQFYISMLIAVAAAVWHLRRTRSDANAVLLVMLLAAVAMSALHLKIMPYATFLAIPPLAAVLGTLPAIGSVSALSARLVGFLIVNQHSILALLLTAASLAAPATHAPGGDAGTWSATNRSLEDCTATASITPLAALPAGLVVTDIDIGAFIVALTPHRVLSAPYHRLDKAILEGERIRAAAPDEAERRLRRIGADYVAICRAMPAAPSEAATLATLLHADAPPPYLEKISLPAATPLRVWRMKPLH